ncbi:MAG: hypothetical protein C4526_06535 [Nitrospiraceae bacterium]|nr:MAG: hypothetical protein C4526_06535 [Nitrospiraceae bacterium]
MGNNEKLILLAKDLARENEMTYVDNSEIKIVTKGDFIIVEFIPKPKNILGGGGRIFFKQEKDEFKFIKIERWQ